MATASDKRSLWKAIGVLLAFIATAVVVIGIAAFSRVPDAPPGETRDLALGLMCVLLALVCGVMAWACLATGRRDERRDEA
jgi:drug/metabolite transporter (DMT)-like permease